MNNEQRAQALNNGHHARVLLEQQTLWDLSEVLTSMDSLIAVPFDISLCKDAAELVDNLARYIETQDVTLGELANQLRNASEFVPTAEAAS